jgi:hypothetical protein
MKTILEMIILNGSLNRAGEMGSKRRIRIARVVVAPEPGSRQFQVSDANRKAFAEEQISFFGRLAIRATRFGPGADVAFTAGCETPTAEKSPRQGNDRGRFKGAIRVPLRSLSVFFNNLVLRRIPRKSLKSLPLLFSIPTAPTNHPFSQQQLSDLSRRQKTAIRASRVAPWLERTNP